MIQRFIQSISHIRISTSIATGGLAVGSIVVGIFGSNISSGEEDTEDQKDQADDGTDNDDF